MLDWRVLGDGIWHFGGWFRSRQVAGFLVQSGVAVEERCLTGIASGLHTGRVLGEPWQYIQGPEGFLLILGS